MKNNRSIIPIIKRKISFNDVFTSIIYPEKKRKKFKCPFCKKFSFVIYDETGTCFNTECKFQGDIIDLYQKHYGYNFVDALNNIQKDFRDKLKEINDFDSVFEIGEREIEKIKFADVKFIRHFKIFMKIMDISQRFLAEEFGISRKYINLVLNEKTGHQDITLQTWKRIIGKMAMIYELRREKFYTLIDLWCDDKTIDIIKKSNEKFKLIYGL